VGEPVPHTTQQGDHLRIAVESEAGVGYVPPAAPPPPRVKPPTLAHRVISSGVHTAWRWVARQGAIGPGDREARRFGYFGSGSCVAFPPGAVFGQRWIHVGQDTLVGPHVSISAGMVPGQRMVTDPVVRIGDRCMIGRGSHIVGHFQLEIGDDVHTGPYVYITDQNHGYEDPDRVVHEQWPTDVPVLIGDGCWLGTRVVILPGTVLGRNVVVGAGAVVRGQFPDHCVIAGVPARIVRRYVRGSGWVSGTDRNGGEDPTVAPSPPVGSDHGMPRPLVPVISEVPDGGSVRLKASGSPNR
jgi:acetyltransferase-like isoleucine patch superfamily enzyme